MQECITHHHACACREVKIQKLVEALEHYAQEPIKKTGKDLDDPDWDITIHVWPGNDDGEKARETLKIWNE